jgi:hypothetical protein
VGIIIIARGIIIIPYGIIIIAKIYYLFKKNNILLLIYV